MNNFLANIPIGSRSVNDYFARVGITNTHKERERERINIIVLNERGVSIFIDSFISLGKRHASTLKDLFYQRNITL